MEKDIIKIFDNEDLEILRTIILERSTFYTRKVVDYRVLMLKSQDKEYIEARKNNYEYDCKVKNVLDTFYDYLFNLYFKK